MTSPFDDAHETPPVQRFAELVVTRWKWLLAGTLVGLVAAAAVTAATEDLYKAQARLYVNIPAAQGIQEALQGVQLSSQLLASYAEIGESRSVAVEVSEALDGEVTSGEVLRKVSVDVREPTLLLEIEAQSASPQTAARLADAAAQVLIERVAELESGREDPVQAQLIDAATVPDDPVEPQPAQNLVIGLVLGLFAGLGGALTASALDLSVRSVDDAEQATRAPLLASIPLQKEIRGHRLVDRDSPTGEAIRSLRTSVRFAALDRSLDTLLVTSAGAQDGKSTVAANLARSCAEDGLRVVLVDADLRRPVLHDVFSIENQPGLAGVIHGAATVADAVVEVAPSLRVLPAGPPPDRPTELLGEKRAERALQQLSVGADLVIVDSPPLAAVTDSVVLASIVDAAVIVTRMQRTERRALSEARDRLDVVGARVLGCVLNGVKRRGREYYTYRPFDR